MKSLLLIRGLPGSGKSELATILSEEGKYPVFSVDDYFTDPKGNYEFIFSDNHKAYASCETNCREAMQNGILKILIANVFSEDWEMQPYFRMAEELSYKVFVFTVEKYHDGENIHGVSREQLEKIASKFRVKLT